MNRPPAPPRYLVSSSSQPTISQHNKKRNRQFQTTFPGAMNVNKRSKQDEPTSSHWPPPQSQYPSSQPLQNSYDCSATESQRPIPPIPANLPIANQPNLVVVNIKEIRSAQKHPMGGVTIHKHGRAVRAQLLELVGTITSIQVTKGILKFSVSDETDSSGLPVEFFPETEQDPLLRVGGFYRIIGRVSINAKREVTSFEGMGVFQCNDPEERHLIREIGRTVF